MTKKEIVKQIADELRIPQQQAKEVVLMTFDAIINTLVEEGRIELRNFGVFVVKLRKRRAARNPRTNEPVQVEEKKVVTFQPGKLMEERVRSAKKVLEPKRRTKKLAGGDAARVRKAPKPRKDEPIAPPLPTPGLEGLAPESTPDSSTVSGPEAPSNSTE